MNLSKERNFYKTAYQISHGPVTLPPVKTIYGEEYEVKDVLCPPLDHISTYLTTYKSSYAGKGRICQILERKPPHMPVIINTRLKYVPLEFPGKTEYAEQFIEKEPEIEKPSIIVDELIPTPKYYNERNNWDNVNVDTCLARELDIYLTSYRRNFRRYTNEELKLPLYMKNITTVHDFTGEPKIRRPCDTLPSYDTEYQHRNTPMVDKGPPQSDGKIRLLHKVVARVPYSGMTTEVRDNFIPQQVIE